MLERVLVEQTLEFFLILDDLPDDEIDPDIAVKLAEGIAGDLQQLDRASRERLVAIALEVAGDWDRDEWIASGDRLRGVLESLDLLRD